MFKLYMQPYIYKKLQAYDKDGNKIPYAIYDGDYVIEEIQSIQTDISYFHNLNKINK